MAEPLVLTFDVGTQSVRAMLVNRKGDIVSISQTKYEVPYFAKNPNWAEQKPEFYFDMLCKTSRELRKKSEALFSDIFAVTVTCIRDTPVLLDADYKPLRDIIVWLDSREAENENPFTPVQKAALTLVGMKDAIIAQHQKSPLNWIKENEPENWEKTAHCVMLPTYINYLLTGALKDSAANMIGHIPFDYKNRRWAKEGDLTRCVMDIPMDKLCELCLSGDTVGSITAHAAEASGIPAGLPLIATGSDKGCETLGLSVVSPNKASISFGSSATIQFSTDKYFEPQQFFPAYPAIINTLFNPEIQIYRGYWMISWFKNEFASKECIEATKLGVSPEQLLNKRLAEVPAGCEGLLLQPFWGPGVSAPEAKGAIIGFSDVHTRIHIYRAIIEGIGFALLDGMYTMQNRSGQKIDEIFVGGGGSQSDEICQITADMFGLPVKRIQTHEACGLGSSMVAFVASGIFKNYDDAIASMVHVKDEFVPDKETNAVYKEIFSEVYSKLYSQLKPIYKKQKLIAKKHNIEQ